MVSRAAIIFLISLTGAVTKAGAQREAARYEIDAKRVGVSPASKDALPRSREFLRLDSTYYVGWLYEGIYKFERSADYAGFRNAAIPLKKALGLLEKDYGRNMYNLYSSITYFAQNVSRYQDLFMLFNALKQCYDNLEMPDDVMRLLANMDRYHFRKDYFGIYYHRAWTFHRNRFFTSSKFSFLKNSVAENEKAAFQWCYYGLGFIDRNKALNDAWFGPSQATTDRLAIYHYLALLHCYNRNYDSSEYYYQRLAAGGAISWNNYGGMQGEIGNFANSLEYYRKDQYKSFEKLLREPYYYVPELYVYSGRTKDAIAMSREIINQNGSSPGFGWYNIALARSYLYDGQLDSAAWCLDKAASFREIHIGTTLTQSQYEFSINLLRVQLLDKRIALVKFLDKHWWLSPSALYRVAGYVAQKKIAEYAVVNEMADNPDRDRMVYDLFCSEATTTFDEAWFLMRDFSPNYFIKKYRNYTQTDSRANIQRYFRLFSAAFEWEHGDNRKAAGEFDALAHTALVDTAHEKLFMVRLFEWEARAAGKSNETQSLDYFRNQAFNTFPQLGPFSGIPQAVNLQVTGVSDGTVRSVVSDIRGCNVSWSDNTDAPRASVGFEKRGARYQAVITVTTNDGRVIVNNRLIFQKAENIGGEIALRIFGKGGAAVME